MHSLFTIIIYICIKLHQPPYHLPQHTHREPHYLQLQGGQQTKCGYFLDFSGPKCFLKDKIRIWEIKPDFTN